MNSIIITHESDVDGIFSAALTLIRFPQSKVLFTSYGKDNFSKIAERVYKEVISVQGKGQVIITDLGLNEDILPLINEIFNFLRSNSWSILWIDHHPWSKNAIESFTSNECCKLIIDNSGDKCATELVYQNFLTDNSTAKALARIAHSTDFFINDVEIPPLPEIITFYKTLPDFYSKLLNLAKKVANGVLWDVEIQTDYDEYAKFRNKAKMDAISNTKLINGPSGLKMAFVPVSPYIQVSLFSVEVFNQTKADVAFFYNLDGKISIRRNNESVKCNMIANQLMEGGGHIYAAGGRAKSNPQHLNKLIEELTLAVDMSLNSTAFSN